MAYTPNTTWEDAPSTDTPITAAALNHMEAGIVEGAQAASTSQAGNVELATSGEMTTGTDTARVPSVAVVAGAIAALTKSSVGLGNVDNTSDATKNAATATLTGKTIDGASNTITGLNYDSFPGLEDAVNSIPDMTGVPREVYYSGSWPNRSASGTTDPDVRVIWVGGTTPPAVSGTGATGAIGSSTAGVIKDRWVPYV